MVFDESKLEDTQLEVEKCEYEYTCDACFADIKVGDASLTGIASCCGGGCVRTICFECVKRIADFAKDNELV